MVVPEPVIEKARSLLAAATKPIFYHDDDCDGTASFVIGYQFCKGQKGEGKGIPVKRSPSVTSNFLRYSQEFGADLIVVLDKPKVDRDFLQQAGLPVLWIDHHEPQLDTIKDLSNVTYLNPRIWDDNDTRPTSYWSYQITKTNLWMATVGSVGDWHVPDFIEEFGQKYPDLLPAKHDKIEELYIDSPIGTIIRVIQFNLKGMTSDSKKSVLTLTRIESPYEILKQTSSKGKFLWKKFEKLAPDYDRMLVEARATAAGSNDKILAYIYDNQDMTFTGELANELLIRYPQRVILVGRRNDGFVKCSARSKDVDLPAALNEAMKGCEGYGGGHKRAVGIVVAEKDWEKFYNKFNEMVSK